MVMDTRAWYTAFVALIAVQRLFEMRLARRNTRALLARHGVEAGRAHFPLMVALHVAFLVACPAEVWLLARPFVGWIGWPALALCLAAQGLRSWAIRALGNRWTVRVIAVPGTLSVTRGPYSYIRHPNYVAVIVEIATIPLVHTAWITAVVFSALNGLLLARRIKVEEALLRQVGGYGDGLDHVPRFVPRG